MALTSAYNFFLYMLIYEESSKYEHSDFMSLSIYRENVETESPNKISFKLNLKRTNPELGEKILNYSNIVYAGTFEEIFKHVKKFHPQVFAQEQIKELNSIYSTMSENSIHFPYGTNDGEEHNSRNTSSV